jgi:ABC-type multidrug transport system ATPase subunit
MHLLTLLQDLAASGRAICTTIHQPSSRLYQKLDQLMLLAEGHCMYYGPAHNVRPGLASMGSDAACTFEGAWLQHVVVGS